MAGLDDLDPAFVLPESVTDVGLRGLYEVIVHRLRAEASHLPMLTLQNLLIERIAYNYIVLRARERNELGGFTSASVQKDYNVFWLQMCSEMNRMLGKPEPMSGVERKTLLKDMQQIIVSTLATVPDPMVRNDLLERMASAFETAGI